MVTGLLGCSVANNPATIDDLMKDYDGDVPGASLLITRDGEVITKSYGFADLEARTPATSQSNYRLASVTKQFTAAAILILAERGQLRLDDPIRTHLPSLPDAASTITIRHVLTHTSGLIDYEDVIPEGTTVQLRDADVLRLLESQNKTYFAPGSDYRYSNSGYSLLALIIERVSGESFATFLRRNIFEPLGMHNTVAFEDGISVVANRAYGYTKNEDGTWTRTDQSLTSAVLGDGGIYSSVDDLAKWDAALYDGRFREALQPRVQTDDAKIRYGYGWRITGDMVWHSGETRGFRNVILRFPERRLTVVLLTNRNAPPPYDTALKIANMFAERRRPGG